MNYFKNLYNSIKSGFKAKANGDALKKTNPMQNQPIIVTIKGVRFIKQTDGEVTVYHMIR